MHPDAPYFGILLCLTPDDFTRQVESAATQWVNNRLTLLYKRAYPISGKKQGNAISGLTFT
jgi:hypothetical protein